MNWINVIVWGIFIIAILIAMVIIPYCLAQKARFVYAIREGFVTILVKGGVNGAFDRLVGAMKDRKINEQTAEITEDKTAKPMGFWGFIWIGIWPLKSAMTFNTEQTKLKNEDDASLGYEVVKYQKTIYLPIQSTERLLVKNFALADMAKVDLDTVITLELVNAYTAHIKNRGSIKRVKAVAEEGLREQLSGIEYEQALKLKNGTGKGLEPLIKNLNEEDTGFGKLGVVTGYEIRTINIVGIRLSGSTAAAMEAVFVQHVTADKGAEATIITAKANAKKIRIEGEATGKAKSALVDQEIRRLEAQRQLTPEQAMALAVENTKATVVSVNSQSPAATPLINVPPRTP